jgi:hypothetical protein
MSVRPDLPWYWRPLWLAAGAVVLVGAAWMVADAAGAFDASLRADVREIRHLQQELAQQEAELARWRARGAQADRQLQMERAAGGDLAKQVKSLTFENAALKEDLAFFQSIMSATGSPGGTITVNRFRLRPEAEPGEYRYQMLLVQNGQRSKEFRGRLEFVLDVHSAGRKLVLVIPAEAERESKDYQLSFKFFQRIEGTFKLTPGSELTRMQVRVFEKGARTPKLTQSLSVSPDGG